MQKRQSRLLGGLVSRAASDWVTGLNLLLEMLETVDRPMTCPSESAQVRSRYKGQTALIQLDAGAFGSVWEYKGVVFKVMASEEDGAVPYLRWVMRNPSPYAPTVLHMQTMRCGAAVAVMEKLQSYGIVSDLDISGDEIAARINHKRDVASACSSVIRGYTCLHSRSTAIGESYPGLFEFCGRVRDSGLCEEFYIDLHSENIMYREDGTPVVNDPFAARIM